MKRKFILHTTFLLCCIFLYSCIESQKNNTNEQAKFSTEINKVSDMVNYADIVSECKLIKLETTPQSLLGDIEKLLIANDKIVILSNNIYCFDMKGNFLFALDKRGRGPMEFIRADDISISNNKLYLYDNSQWRILSFDINSGNHLKTYPLPYSVPRVEVVGDNMIVDRANFPSKLIKSNERIFISSLEKPQQVISTYFSEQEYEVETEQQFVGYNGVAYLSNPFRGKTYKIQVDSVENYFQVKGDKVLTDNEIELLLERNSYFSDAVSLSGKIYGFERFYESNDFITCDFFMGDKKIHLVYDKTTGKNHIFTTVKRAYYQYPPTEFIGAYGDYFCKIINSETILMNNQVYLSDHKIDDSKLKTDSTYRTINSIMPEENPILALYKFKNIN